MWQVIRFEQRRLGLVPTDDYSDPGEQSVVKAEEKASSADKWIISLQKSVSLALANFSLGAAKFTPDQARPGQPKTNSISTYLLS